MAKKKKKKINAKQFVAKQRPFTSITIISIYSLESITNFKFSIVEVELELQLKIIDDRIKIKITTK